MNKEQFLRGAISNLENKLGEARGDILTLTAENEALKASLPQVKHDAIMKMDHKLASGVTTNCRCGVLGEVGMFIGDYAHELLTTQELAE